MKHNLRLSIWRLLIIAVALIALFGQAPVRTSASRSFSIYFPRVSNLDRSWIAYVPIGVGCPTQPLTIIHPDGTNPITITPPPGEGGFSTTASPAWSFDGKQLVFVGYLACGGPSAIYRIDINGSNLVKIKDVAWAPAGISWSHDGKKIAFDQGEIFVMNSDGSGLTQLTSNGARNTTPDWSPDDQRIAFASDLSGKEGIYVMDANGSNLHLLGDPNFDETDPAWSPDGTQIAFTRNLQAMLTSINVMKADGTGQYEVIASSNPVIGSAWWIARPSWSPDGQRLAFCGSSFHFTWMGIVDVNGDNFTTGPADGCPVWSP